MQYIPRFVIFMPFYRKRHWEPTRNIFQNVFFSTTTYIGILNESFCYEDSVYAGNCFVSTKTVFTLGTSMFGHVKVNARARNVVSKHEQGKAGARDCLPEQYLDRNIAHIVS